jgi:hypothetical protein
LKDPICFQASFRGNGMISWCCGYSAHALEIS